MKKIIFSILALSVIALCCSLNLQAQSSETDLDQVELMKQFIGPWKAELREDTTLLWWFRPSSFGEGYNSIAHWEAKGKTYRTTQGIIGFSGSPKKGFSGVSFYILWPDGTLSRDEGKFVSEKKLYIERFNKTHTKAFAKWELEFQSQDKFTSTWTPQGPNGTWEDDQVTIWKFIRVK